MLIRCPERAGNRQPLMTPSKRLASGPRPIGHEGMWLSISRADSSLSFHVNCRTNSVHFPNARSKCSVFHPTQISRGSSMKSPTCSSHCTCIAITSCQHSNMGSSSSFCFCTLLLLLLHPGNSTLAAKSASSKDACLSWRLSVETNNLRNWTVVPSACIGYVTEYMTAGQYEEDYSVAIAQCQAYLKTLHPIGDGKDAWVFDIDQTALSGISFLANHKYGGEAVNSTLAEDWIFEAKAPALAGALHLSSQVISSGFKVFFLTGRDLKYLAATAKNLRKAGYRNWSGLILRGKNDQGKPAVVYKSEKRGELVKRGYRIWGNVGDQWSDLTGNYPGHRTFKLPNPMYYVN